MCSWERFCTFAREPEQRKVGIDARVTLEKELDHLGFFATDAQTHLEQEIAKIIAQGRLIARSRHRGFGKNYLFSKTDSRSKQS